MVIARHCGEEWDGEVVIGDVRTIHLELDQIAHGHECIVGTCIAGANELDRVIEVEFHGICVGRLLFLYLVD